MQCPYNLSLISKVKESMMTRKYELSSVASTVASKPPPGICRFRLQKTSVSRHTKFRALEWHAEGSKKVGVAGKKSCKVAGLHGIGRRAEEAVWRMEQGGSRSFAAAEGSPGQRARMGGSQKADHGRGPGRDHTSRPAQQAEAGPVGDLGRWAGMGIAGGQGGDRPTVHSALTGPPAAGSSRGPARPARPGADGPTHR